MRLQLTLVIIIISFWGCRKKDKDGPDTSQVTVSTDAAALGARIATTDAGVVYVDPSAGGQQKMTADSSSNTYPMELVASVAPPVYMNDTLRATHVEINGKYAYVSYNVEGARYKGGVDVFDISTATTPVLVSSVLFPNTDINSIAYYDNKLYVAGAQEAGTPAMVGYLQLSAGLPTTTFVSVNYTGFSGTGVAVYDNKVYLTTGSTGGLFVLNPTTLAQTHNVTLKDARGVAINPSYVAVQTGNSGIFLYNRSTNEQVRNIGMPEDIAESKRTMDFNGNNLIVAAGKNGNVYFDASTGVRLSDIALPVSLPDVNSNDIVTNAVSYNNGLFFSANGAAGAYISTENATTHVMKRLGSFGFGTGSSANYVKSKDNYVFVAAGKGGMKIIRFTTSPAAACASYPNYTGNTNLNINSGQNLKHSGSLLLSSLNVNSNASFFYCGSLGISNSVNVNSNGTLEINGALAFGSAGKTLTVNSNATLKITGNVTIYGNLVLNSNARLEFAGTGNSITILGTVTKGAAVTITGSFTDVSGKL